MKPRRVWSCVGVAKSCTRQPQLVLPVSDGWMWFACVECAKALHKHGVVL